MKRRAAPIGTRCSATTSEGRCKSAYIIGGEPLLCGLHHARLRRSVAAFNAVPATWTELRPRGWKPPANFGAVVLGHDGTLRFLASADGEPVSIADGGGFVGVDSSEAYDRAVVVERPKMGWLRRLSLDSPGLAAALRKAADLKPGKRVK